MCVCRSILLSLYFLCLAAYASNAEIIEIPTEVYDLAGGMDGNRSKYKSYSTGQHASCVHNKKLSTCSDVWVCYMALEGSGTRFTYPPRFAKSGLISRIHNGNWVKEAKNRKFNENSCLQTLLEFYPNKRRKNENTHTIKKQEPTSSAYKLSGSLRESFTSLSLANRKFIQSKLYLEGYYKSNIDGLYGNRTAAALIAYNKEHHNDADLKNSINVVSLLNNIRNETSSPKIAKKKSEPNTENNNMNLLKNILLFGAGALAVANGGGDAFIEGFVSGKSESPVVSPENKSNSSSGSNGCSSDMSCGYGQKCLKKMGQLLGVCKTTPDKSTPSHLSVLPGNGKGCRRSSECPSGFRCDLTYNACVR